MTNEEAIKHLQTYSTTMGSGQTTDEQHKEAKRMAIEALSNSQKQSESLIRTSTDSVSEADIIYRPERLTDDDFETIRIHLNACKEKLCNQHRWEEAEEYQRIIDRFITFASARPEIIRCKDCRHGVDYYHEGDCYCSNPKWGLKYFGGSWKFYCADAERRQ